MYKVKVLLPLLFFLTTSILLTGQTVADALRYSRYEGGGTARFLGTGQSMSALGADMGAIGNNPAGIGMFRYSALSVTPVFDFTTTESRLVSDDRNPLSSRTDESLYFQNLGVVFANRPYASKWKTANFGISFQRLAHFNRNFFFEGFSPGSIVNRFLEQANGSTGLDDFESGLAFDAVAIYDLDDNGVLESDFDGSPDAVLFRRQDITTEGSIDEIQFSFGGNYDEKVIFGFAVGIPILNYTEDRIYYESDDADEVPFFDELEFADRVTTNGFGFNAKAGVIIRASQVVRIGASVQTPTFWNLDDTYISDLRYSYTDDGEAFDNTASSPEGIFEYRLRTPLRVNGRIGLVVQRSGFITGEIEMVDYSGATFRFDDFPADEADANRDISQTLDRVINIRVGGEYAYEIFRFQGGVGIHPSPLLNDSDVDYSWGVGVGIRTKSFFGGLAFNNSIVSSRYTPYAVSDAFPTQVVENESTRSRLVLTIGFRFE
ncbi:MAG: hypothetical protein AAFO07_11265 [Bacteroidota bacterium]